MLQATWYDVKADSARGLPRFDTHGLGWAASFEAGYPFRQQAGWTLEPHS